MKQTTLLGCCTCLFPPHLPEEPEVAGPMDSSWNNGAKETEQIFFLTASFQEWVKPKLGKGEDLTRYKMEIMALHLFWHYFRL